jgi:hypothetical protein
MVKPFLLENATLYVARIYGTGNRIGKAAGHFTNKKAAVSRHAGNNEHNEDGRQIVLPSCW